MNIRPEVSIMLQDFATNAACLEGEFARRSLAAHTVGELITMGLTDAEMKETGAWIQQHASWLDITAANWSSMTRHARKMNREADAKRSHDEGRLMPTPSDPMRVIRKILETNKENGILIRWWRGDFYNYTGTHWARVSESTIKGQLYERLEHCEYEDDRGNIKPWRPNPRNIAAATEALAIGAARRDENLPEDRVLACINGVVDPVSRQLTEHNPDMFNLSSAPITYNPVAGCPEWLKFLEASLPDDPEAWRLLQQWFGYILSGRTDLHKIMVLYGLPRSGKGTIARILTALIGRDNIASPTMSQLTRQFGLASLIGKPLAIMGDVNWKVKDMATAAEVLKTISGEDTIGIDRKNRDEWIGKLPTRIMALSNDPPEFRDNTAALPGRIILVKFQVSFLGREDFGLETRLLAELDGILNWALDGLRDLEANGNRFVIPTSSSEVADETRRLSNPVYAWIQDECQVGDGKECKLDDAYAAYESYAQRNGHRCVAKNEFSKRVIAAGNGAYKVDKLRRDGTQARWILGVAKDVDHNGLSNWHTPMIGASITRQAALN